MPLVDGKGRLFGKINLLDLVVVVAVVAVGGRFGYKWYQGRNAATATQATKVRVTVVLPDASEAKVNAVKVGQDVYDSKSGAYLGKIVNISVEPFIVRGASSEYPSKYSSNLLVTIEGVGHRVGAGATLGGLDQGVGTADFLKGDGWSHAGTTLKVE